MDKARRAVRGFEQILWTRDDGQFSSNLPEFSGRREAQAHR